VYPAVVEKPLRLGLGGQLKTRAVSTGQRNIMVKFQGDTWGESGWGDDRETTHDG
jgi:hypothetical protein